MKIHEIFLFGCIYFFSGMLYAYSIVPDPYVDTTPVQHIIKIKTIFYDKKAIFTAYTLIEGETDSSPCIGAGNHNLCDIKKEEPNKCIAAHRTYALHTRINVEGIGECEILDRTSEKYGNRIDLVFNTREEALKFGKKTLSYSVIVY